MTNLDGITRPVFVGEPLNHPLLIEASAGTGKTFSLIHILLRLIVERGFSIERILVVTFTNLATYELKSRLRARLNEVNDIIKNVSSKGSNEEQIDQIIECALKTNDLTLAVQFDEWKKQKRKLEDINESIGKALKRIDDASVFTIHSFCQKMLKQYAFSSYGSFDLEIGNGEVLAAKAVNDEIRNRLPKISKKSRKSFLEVKHFDDYLAHFSRLPKEDQDTNKIKFNKHEDELKKFLPDAAKRYQKLKKQNKVVTQDDLLVLVEANSTGDFAEKVRESYDAVLIDEFQDTDSVQYSIFRKIFLDTADGGEEGTEEQKPIIFVGDPKQSIYGWRSADIDCYLSAKKKIKENQQLETNFRSTPGLVEAANKTFSIKNAFRKEGLNYSDIYFKNHLLPLFREISKGEFEPVIPLKILLEKHHEYCGEDLKALEDWAVAEDIAQLLDGNHYLGNGSDDEGRPRKLRQSDIAVLVRSRTAAGGLIKELAKRGISCSAVTNTDVLDTEEAAEILYILQAMEDPKNLRATIAARSTRIFGETLSNINEDVNARRKALKALNRAGKTFAAKGVVAAFYELFNEYDVEKRRLKQFQGERQLTNYQHILELLHKQNRRTKNISGLIRWMQKHKTSDNDERKIRRESDDDLVRIMTIHKSKGLEYPVVYLLRAGSPLDNRISDYVVKLPQKVEGDKEGIEGNQIYQYVTDKDDSKQERKNNKVEEEIRLNYVAFTRASAHLVIPMFYERKVDETTSEGVIDLKKLSIMAQIWCSTIREELETKKKEIESNCKNTKKEITKKYYTRTTKNETPEETAIREEKEKIKERERNLADEKEKEELKSAEVSYCHMMENRLSNPILEDSDLSTRVQAALKDEIENEDKESPFRGKVSEDSIKGYKVGEKKEVSIDDYRNNKITIIKRPDSEPLDLRASNPANQGQRKSDWGQTSFSGLTANIPWSKDVPIFDEGGEPETGEQPNTSQGSDTSWDPLRYKPKTVNAADYGTFLHKLIEKIGNTDFSLAQTSISQIVEEELVRSSIEKASEKEKPSTGREGGTEKDNGDNGTSDAGKKKKNQDHAEALSQMLDNVLHVPMFEDILQDPKFEDVKGLDKLSNFKLCDLNSKNKIHEMDFLIGVGKPIEGRETLTAQKLGLLLESFDDPLYKGLNLLETGMTGYLTGQIDLAFQVNGMFWIIDWKSNRLSSKQEDYQREALANHMKKHRYTLQYLLYTVALKRFLEARFGDENKDCYDLIGGAAYFFLRGINKEKPSQGIFFDRPNKYLIKCLDDALRNGYDANVVKGYVELSKAGGKND